MSDDTLYIGEDPERVEAGPAPDLFTVYSQGNLVAYLYGLRDSIACSSEDPSFIGFVQTYRHLLWTHGSALRRLQGEKVFNILGAAVVLIDGKHRPVWDPIPGLDNVRVVLPRASHTLTPQEVFLLVKRLGF